MDKVKIALALLKKHHFWVMTGTVVLLSFVGWFVATSQLWKDYQTNKATIETKFKALAKINSEERENQKWIEGIEAETQRLKVKVRTAWDQVYTEQKTNVLKWPEVGGPRNKATLERLGPNEDIPIAIRRAYVNYIKNEFPRLLKIVDARDEHKEKDKKVAYEEPETPHKVIWNEANQTGVFEKLNLDRVPDSQKVRDLQEDLWVYQALLKIVANLNEFSTGNYNAKVKEIQGLLIGSEAASEFQSGMAEGRLEHVEGASSGAKPAGSAASPSESPSVVSDRYVNDKGLPLSTTDVAPEFKRMPVVMRLVMDQRDVLRLLVECANSPLPVEVRHLHIHTRKGTPNPGAKKGDAEKELNSYDMTVEVAGLIYIFNPPDPTKLGEVLAAATPGAPAAEPTPANPGGVVAPAVPANPAAGEPGPAGGGKALAEPGAGAAKPDAAATPEEEMEKTDGVKEQ